MSSPFATSWRASFFSDKCFSRKMPNGLTGEDLRAMDLTYSNKDITTRTFSRSRRVTEVCGPSHPDLHRYLRKIKIFCLTLPSARTYIDVEGEKLSMIATTQHSAPLTLSIKYPGAADLAPGYMVTTEFSSIGGVDIETASENTPHGESLVRKRVRYDHPALHKAAQSICQEAYKIVRHHGPMFSGMYFVAEREFDALDTALQELRDGADVLNDEARERRSDRQTKIEIYPFQADANNPRLALRVGRVLHELLVRLKESFDSDTRQDFVGEWRMTKNMDKVVTGMQSQVMREALRSAEDQRPVMIAQAGGRRGVAQVVKDHGGHLPELDYRAIDKAIALFAPAVDII